MQSSSSWAIFHRHSIIKWADIALETYYSRRKDSFHFGNNLSLVQHLPEQRDNAGRPDLEQALGHGRKNPNRWLGLTGSNIFVDTRSPPTRRICAEPARVAGLCLSRPRSEGSTSRAGLQHLPPDRICSLGPCRKQFRPHPGDLARFRSQFARVGPDPVESLFHSGSNQRIGSRQTYMRPGLETGFREEQTCDSATTTRRSR
jgi:hypothetical protein